MTRKHKRVQSVSSPVSPNNGGGGSSQGGSKELSPKDSSSNGTSHGSPSSPSSNKSNSSVVEALLLSPKGPSFSSLLWASAAAGTQWTAKRFGGVSPLPRTGAAAVTMGTSLFVFGGKDAHGTLHADVAELSTSNAGWWNAVSALGTARPSARANAVFVGNSTGRIFCFGGRSVLGDVNGSTVSDQSVYILDSANGKFIWSKPRISGPVPSAREQHAACMTRDNNVFMLGGLVGDGASPQPTNDAFLFNMQTMSWSSISARGPQARFGHIVAFFEGVVYVIGGATAAGTDGVVSVLNDIWLYRFKTASWERVNPASALPPARYGHASGIAGYDIVIHGGRDAQGSALGDIWLYSTKTNVWRSLDKLKAVPAPRYNHTIVVIKSTFFLFGGSTNSGTLTDEVFLIDANKAITEGASHPESTDDIATAASGAAATSPAAGNPQSPPLEATASATVKEIKSHFEAVQSDHHHHSDTSGQGKSLVRPHNKAEPLNVGTGNSDDHSHFSAKKAQLEKELEQLKASLAAETSAREQAQSEAGQVKAALKASQDEREREKADYAEKLAGVESLSASLQSENATLKGDIQKIQALLLDVLGREQSRHGELQSLHAIVTDTAAAAAPKSVSSASSSSSGSVTAFMAPVARALQADLLASQEQLHELTLLTDAATGKELTPVEWKARADAAELMIASLHTELNDANRDLQNLREEFVSTQRRARQAAVSVTKLEEELVSVRADASRVAHLEQELGVLKAAFELGKKIGSGDGIFDITEWKGKFEGLQAEKVELESRLRGLQAQLSDAQLKGSSAQHSLKDTRRALLDDTPVAHQKEMDDADVIFTRVQATLLADKLVVGLVANVQRDLIATSSFTNPTEESVATWVIDRVMVHAKLEALR